jgi:plastocyanin
MRRLPLTLFAAFAIGALAACGGGSTPAPASTPAVTPSTATSSAAGGATGCATAAAGASAATTVTIKDFKYSATSVQAKVGDVVAWTNQDSAPHTATMDDGACDTGQIANGATAMLVFRTAGTYTYHCAVHPGQMKDVTIVVQ